MPPRAKKRLGRPPASDGAQTRQRILAAATKLFGERGYEKSTNRDIAEAADLSMPSIYYYYPSKKDLYAGVCEEATQLIGDIGRRALAERQGFVDRIGMLAREIVETNLAVPDAPAFIVSAPTDARRHPELAPYVAGLMGDFTGWVRQMVEEGIESGDVVNTTDVETVTNLLLALLFGIGSAATMVPADRYALVLDQFQALMAGQLIRRKGTRRLTASRAAS